MRDNGAPGVGKTPLAVVEEYGVDRLLGEVTDEPRERRCRPLPMRRVLIPKPGLDALQVHIDECYRGRRWVVETSPIAVRRSRMRG